MEDADTITEWIRKNEINTRKKSDKELLKLLEELFTELYPSLRLENGIALSWVRGDSYNQMSKDYGIAIVDIEKLCQKIISFQMSFLVGNVIDLVDIGCVNIDELQLLQQSIKYGVNSKTAVSICERVFNDRFLAKKISLIIGDNGISTDNIITTVRGKKDEILLLLKKYPTYFENVVINL